MRIVGIGGGTGLPVLLSGLKAYSESAGHGDIDLTAIVAVSDNGGSTGALRKTFNMPAMGDVRNCLIALAGERSLLASVCAHRFENAAGFNGHSVGNLILSALYQRTGDFSAAVQQASELLQVNGRVLPVSNVPLTLCAEYEDGTTVSGESSFTWRGNRMRRVWIEPPDPPAAPAVLSAIQSADAIVLGPGSLYTSIVSNLLVAGIGQAIRASAAVTIYVCNLMTQPGETDGFSDVDHLRELQSYLPPDSIDVCIVNEEHIGMGLAERYSNTGSAAVLASRNEICGMGIVPAVAPLLKEGEPKARHDPAALAQLVVSVARGSEAVVRADKRCAAGLTVSSDAEKRKELEVTCAESSDI